MSEPARIAPDDLTKLQTLTDAQADTEVVAREARRAADAARDALQNFYRKLPRQYDIPAGYAVNVDTGEIVKVPTAAR